MKPSGPQKERIKRALLAKQDYTCPYCGFYVDEETSNIDHIIPRAKGGTWAKTNLVASHTWCNTFKGSVFIPADVLHAKKTLVHKIFRTRSRPGLIRLERIGV